MQPAARGSSPTATGWTVMVSTLSLLPSAAMTRQQQQLGGNSKAQALHPNKLAAAAAVVKQSSAAMGNCRPISLQRVLLQWLAPWWRLLWSCSSTGRRRDRYRQVP